MIEFLLQHQLWMAVGIYWIFSAAVSSMPEPPTGGSARYVWLYRFLHTIAGNITTVLGTRIPGFKIAGPLLLAALVFPAAACTAHYTIHPGALNVADSAAYDRLLVAEATIDQARVNQTRTLSSTEKDALNTLIRPYDVARDSWLTYRGAIATNFPPDPYSEMYLHNGSVGAAVRRFQAVPDSRAGAIAPAPHRTTAGAM